MKFKILPVLIFLFSSQLFAQTPEITSWLINTTGLTGYGGISANVQSVKYTSTDVYVSATGIPSYSIGPWSGNPNTPVNQNFVFKITRTPAANTGTLVNTPLGHIAVLKNGITLFNAKDAASYLNQGVWYQNAVYVEAVSFDACLGHPAPGGEYHQHQDPKCVFSDHDSSSHSPIIGYAFDGFPIYGAFAYAATNGTGGITRMRTSYRKRNITTRTTLPDGSTASSAGPAVSGTYPLGYYIEDYEYIPNLGHLDTLNGKFCITPEYPSGTYAYFITIDANGASEYPYAVGPNYYGTVQSGNTGPSSGHNTIPGAAVSYMPTGISNNYNSEKLEFYPNPVSEKLHLQLPLGKRIKKIEIFNPAGLAVFSSDQLDGNPDIDVSILSSGLYFMKVSDEEGKFYMSKMVKR
jgi:hypothetical protein